MNSRPLSTAKSLDSFPDGNAGSISHCRPWLSCKNWKKERRRRSRPPPIGGKKNEPLVSDGASDALVHQKFDLGPAIFTSPGRSLVGGGRVALTHLRQERQCDQLERHSPEADMQPPLERVPCLALDCSQRYLPSRQSPPPGPRSPSGVPSFSQ